MGGSGTRSYTIAELAELYDVTARTLRYYEEVGLLSPLRAGTRRIYSDRDRVRVQLILRGRRLGFGIPEIAGMLELYDADPTEVMQLREVIRRGDEKLAEIDRQIEDLRAVRGELAEWRDRMETALAERLDPGKSAGKTGDAGREGRLGRSGGTANAAKKNGEAQQ